MLGALAPRLSSRSGLRARSANAAELNSAELQWVDLDRRGTAQEVGGWDNVLSAKLAAIPAYARRFISKVNVNPLMSASYFVFRSKYNLVLLTKAQSPLLVRNSWRPIRQTKTSMCKIICLSAPMAQLGRGTKFTCNTLETATKVVSLFTGIEFCYRERANGRRSLPN